MTRDRDTMLCLSRVAVGYRESLPSSAACPATHALDTERRTVGGPLSGEAPRSRRKHPGGLAIRHRKTPEPIRRLSLPSGARRAVTVGQRRQLEDRESGSAVGTPGCPAAPRQHRVSTAIQARRATSPVLCSSDVERRNQERAVGLFVQRFEPVAEYGARFVELVGSLSSAEGAQPVPVWTGPRAK
jgi:hypothetical protein